MKKKMDSRIGLNPTQHDLTTLQEIALKERRNVSDVIRNVLEDVLNGVIPIEADDKFKGLRTPQGVAVDADFKARFDQFKAEKNLSADKILHLALQSLAAGIATK
jgi:hypothetical protein